MPLQLVTLDWRPSLILRGSWSKLTALTHFKRNFRQPIALSVTSNTIWPGYCIIDARARCVFLAVRSDGADSCLGLQRELKSIPGILKRGLITKSLSLSVTHCLQRYSVRRISNKSRRLTQIEVHIFRKGTFLQFAYSIGDDVCIFQRETYPCIVVHTTEATLNVLMNTFNRVCVIIHHTEKIF